MLLKLLEFVKTPTMAITAIALVLVVTITSLVNTLQATTYARVQDNHLILVQAQQDLIEHRAAEERNSAAIMKALEELMKEEKAANATHTKLLQGICFYNASNQAQRDWCMGVK